MKTIFPVCIILLVLAVRGQAQTSRSGNYDVLGDKASLIVIATPTKVQETREVSHITGQRFCLASDDGKKQLIETKGVETTFEVLTVFKGRPDLVTFMLHHYRSDYFDGPGTGALYVSGDPRLVRFDPKSRREYLLFLIEEADGRYAAVSGQDDPADSIKELTRVWR